MKIGIFLSPYNEKAPAGLGRYILELTRELVRQDQENHYYIFLKGKPTPPDFPSNNWEPIYCEGYFWLDDGIKKVSDADVYIFNTPITPLFRRPKNTLVIALDFSYKYLKHLSVGERVRNWFLFLYHRFSLRRADSVVSISEATKRDTVKFFNVPAEKISVIYPGFKKFSAIPEESVLAPEKFFLFIGVIKERKNVFNIVKAYLEFRASHPESEYKLLIAGSARGSYYEMLRKYLEGREYGDSVVFLGHVSDGQVSYLYRRATALVFPSLIEGFGFPILEAMEMLLPVITSNESSLAEIGGGGSAILVNPHSVSEIAGAMKKSTDPLVRQDLMRKGIERCRDFSWDKAAKIMRGFLNTL